MSEQESEYQGISMISGYSPEVVYLPKGATHYMLKPEPEGEKIQPFQEDNHTQRYEQGSAITPRFAHQAITPKVWTLVLEVCIGLAKYEPTFVPGSPRACNFCKYTDFGLFPYQDFPHAPSCPVTFARILRDAVGGE